jgi:hypothetical protein
MQEPNLVMRLAFLGPNSALSAVERVIGLMVAQRTRTAQRSPAERPIAPIVDWLVTKRTTV